jgi:hypothetical protein
MTRRRLLLVLGAGLTALAVLVAAGVMWWLMPPRPGVTEANVAQIRLGMRQEEVEAILGGPPCQYNEGGPVWTESHSSAEKDYKAMWAGGDLVAVVWFRGDGAVARVDFGSASPPSPLQQVINCLRRLLP